MAAEQKLQTKVQKRLKDLGFYVVKTVVTTRSGVPDLLACSPKGYFFAFEIKKDDKQEPSALQLHNLHQICEREGVATCIGSMEALEKVLKFCKKRW